MKFDFLKKLGKTVVSKIPEVKKSKVVSAPEAKKSKIERPIPAKFTIPEFTATITRLQLKRKK